MMKDRYANAAAFRQALEERLRTIAAERGVPLEGLRLKVAIERLLARLFADARATLTWRCLARADERRWHRGSPAPTNRS